MQQTTVSTFYADAADNAILCFTPNKWYMTAEIPGIHYVQELQCKPTSRQIRQFVKSAKKAYGR